MSYSDISKIYKIINYIYGKKCIEDSVGIFENFIQESEIFTKLEANTKIKLRDK